MCNQPDKEILRKIIWDHLETKYPDAMQDLELQFHEGQGDEFNTLANDALSKIDAVVEKVVEKHQWLVDNGGISRNGG